MTSDNVFSDWLTSLVTFFDKMLYSMCKKSRELNIIFQKVGNGNQYLQGRDNKNFTV